MVVYDLLMTPVIGFRAKDLKRHFLTDDINVAQLYPTYATPWTEAHQAPLAHGIFSGKNTGVGCYFLLQEIFQTQGLNPGPGRFITI